LRHGLSNLAVGLCAAQQIVTAETSAKPELAAGLVGAL